MAVNLKIIAIAAVVLIVIGVAVALAPGVFNSGPQPPDVKFVGFGPEGKQTIKEDQTVQLTFKVHNNEPTNISNARIVVSHEGDSRYFAVDKGDYVITPAIGANQGESGIQTITIRGLSLGGQTAIEDEFTISLFVGVERTDVKELAIRVEPA